MCGILVGVWFLNERFQRPTFPPVVTIRGSTFVSEESRLWVRILDVLDQPVPAGGWGLDADRWAPRFP